MSQGGAGGIARVAVTAAGGPIPDRSHRHEDALPRRSARLHRRSVALVHVVAPKSCTDQGENTTDQRRRNSFPPNNLVSRNILVFSCQRHAKEIRTFCVVPKLFWTGMAAKFILMRSNVHSLIVDSLP